MTGCLAITIILLTFALKAVQSPNIIYHGPLDLYHPS
jgi:hypothetical protein